MSIADVDPITAGITMAIGIGFQAYGMGKANSASNRINADEIQKIKYEQQIEGQREQAMSLDYNRRTMEVFRNFQRSRAMGVAAATNQGAQFGSGQSGAYGQAHGEAGVNILGLNQNYKIGENIFGLNAAISNTKIDSANAHKDLQESQGWMSFGQNIFSSASAAGRLGNQFFGK